MRDLNLASQTSPLTLLLGYPGAGKTVLLASWLASRTTDRFAWLSCDEADVEPARFWGALVAAIRRVVPQFGEETLGIIELDGSVSRDALAALIAELGSLLEPIRIVIDDLHLAGNRQLFESLTNFVEWLPANVRLLISSRVEPVLPLHRWRIEGKVAEIRNSELMFSEPEAATLLHLLGVDADVSTVRLLERRTEGWAAGLQLAALSLRDREDADRFLQEFAASDRNVVDYLVGEVLDRQPAHLVAFLLETSVLRELNPEVCQVLTTRTDAAQILRQLEARNLFLVALDRERYRYRYHHLFRDLLRSRLHAADPDREQRLHTAAGDWFANRGELLDAVHHMVLAGDIREAIGLLRARVVQDYFAGRPLGPGSVVETIDIATLSRERELALEYALAIGLQGNLEDAGRWLRRLERMPSGDDHGLFQGRLVAARAMWQTARGDAETSLVGIEKARALLDPSDDLARQLAVIEIRARHYLDDLDGVRRCARESADPVRTLPEFASVVIVSAQAGAEYDAGYLHVADQLAREALQFADDAGTREHHAAGDALRTTGALLLERGSLEEAELMLEKGLRLVERARPVVELLCLIEQHALLLARDRVDDARETLLRARALLSRIDACRSLVARVDSAEARLHLLLGAAGRANAVAASMSPGPRRALISARVAIANGQWASAAAYMEELDGSTWPRHQLEVALLRARIALALGTASREVDHYATCALKIAEEHGFVRTCLLEGSEINGVLEAKLRREPNSPYRTTLATALGSDLPLSQPRYDDQRYGDLSDREREVLRYLSTRMSAGEIAAELYVSLNTLKTHMKSIYRKLDAGSRAEAVATGRNRGFL